MAKNKNYMNKRLENEKAVIREEQNRIITAVSKMSVKEVLKNTGTTLRGLSEQDVTLSRSNYGNNKVTKEKKKSLLQKLASAFINPFTAILFFLAIVSSITDMLFPYFGLFGSDPEDFDCLTVIIILTMVFISGALRFIQESRSGNAAEKLLSMITTTCTITRKDQPKIEVPLEDVVVGDIVHLSAGDMIPADLRIIDAKDLFISQASLTGESEPIEKIAIALNDQKDAITDYQNMAFMGSNVISGSATGVVVSVGDNTLFGSMAVAVASDGVETSFTKGVNAVSWVLIRFMMVMVPLVFVINGITKGDWLAAFLFGISIAVGLTPEMLPMIVTTCLAKGAMSMGKKKTIVKNLNSIQNFGAIDILCTDKTGTLTQDHVVLEYHLNIKGEDDARVLRHAYLNSYFQTGYKNLMDLAIISRTELEEQSNPDLLDLSEHYTKIDEIPFDFKRRRLTTLVEDCNGKKQMVTKGAVEEMLNVCSFAECDGIVKPLDANLQHKILKTVDGLSEKGFRVLAVAQKSNIKESIISVKDESEMVLIGYLAFLDPPKESTQDAIRALKAHGVTTKILTGDNDKVTRTICDQVGLEVKNMILGPELEFMNDIELAEAAEHTQVFAKLTPDQKARIVSVLRENGHTVGFMGDGINDAAAMKAADIGISVDTAVDVAKESADIILLEKDLMVLEEGIIEGRKTYANMIKYIKMTASSNFGNMFSVLAASALLPFLPMMSVHLIFLNLIYDLSCTAIPWDNVDEEFLALPRKWDASSVGNFMIWIGPTSSIFDFTTYSFMYFIICPIFVSHGILFNDLAAHFTGAELEQLQTTYIAMFQAGWFVESMWSQTLVIHMIRTPKIPFIQSRASAPLTLLTFTGIAVLTIIPFTTFGEMLGFVPLPMAYFAYLIPCILLYMILATSLKKAYVRHFGELL